MEVQHTCLKTFLLTACFTNMFPRFHSLSCFFTLTYFFPSLCLLDELSVKKCVINMVLLFVLTLFLLEMGRVFQLHKQGCSVFLAIQSEDIHFLFISASYFLRSNNILVSQNSKVPLCSSLVSHIVLLASLRVHVMLCESNSRCLLCVFLWNTNPFWASSSLHPLCCDLLYW